MSKVKFVSVGLALLALVLVSPGLAAATARPAFPEIIPLPDGWRPEGVAAGYGPTLYAGSLANGAIYQADLRTGQGAVLVPGQAGRVAVGLSFDARTGYLYVAGGPTGKAYVYDTATGATVGVFQLAASATTFVNDVVVTPGAAYFTDSFQPVFYRLPLLPGGGLPAASALQTISLGGDFAFTAGAFNANGIEATPSGDALLIVHSSSGTLYRVDPASGHATAVDLGGASVPAGDGLLLMGSRLYVVQNQLNQIAVVQLDPGFTSGAVVQVLTHPQFDIPTTVAAFGSTLYAVNARFSTPPTPQTGYWIVGLPAGPVLP